MTTVHEGIALAAIAACIGGCYMGPVRTTPQPQPVAQPAPAPQPAPVITVQQAPQHTATAQPVAQPTVQAGATAQGVAVPQQTVQHTASNFGTVTLAPGFMPDPHVVSGTSGGSVNARGRDSSCRGSISQTPDHLFQATAFFDDLRLIGASDQDTTLVVQRPDGSYACNDDAEGRNPIVSGRFQPGTYAVWVGSYRQGVNARYRLGFTELASVTAVSVGGGVQSQPVGNNAGGASNFGTVTLAPGFMPDPHVVRGVSGGQRNANALGGNCRGSISNTPDHILVAQGDFTPMRVIGRSDGDTTLVIQMPNGRYVCDDDGGQGRNPRINRRFRPGAYRVWIGSYRQGVNARYTLGFSELNTQNMALPAP